MRSVFYIIQRKARKALFLIFIHLFSFTSTKFDTKTVSSLSVEMGHLCSSLQCSVQLQCEKRDGLRSAFLFLFWKSLLCMYLAVKAQVLKLAAIQFDGSFSPLVRHPAGLIVTRRLIAVIPYEVNILAALAHFHRKHMKMARNVESLGQPACRPHLSCWIVTASVKMFKLNIQIWHIVCVMSTEG